MALRSKIRVGVLRGGPSQEHEISIKTGAHILKNLPDNYSPVDIFIDKKGSWFVQGVEEPLAKALKKIDVIFNALHGAYGEDGTLQNSLDLFGVPYTGSGQLGSLFAMHKGHSKNFLKKHGIKSPYHKLLKKEEVGKIDFHDLWRSIQNPSMIKPVALGSSLGISIVDNFNAMAPALDKAFEVSDTVIIEEYIKGREATCGVIDSFRGEKIYSLLPVELVLPEDSLFLDYEAKYGGKTGLVSPGRFSALERHEIQEAARKVHKALGLRHYSRSDFIVSPGRGVYFLEVNSLPCLMSGSSYAEALEAVGLSFSEFLGHVIKLAMS
jgi:D-alanine-D-alanine ligase